VRKLRSFLSKVLCSNGLNEVISDFAQWLKVITDQNGLITLTKCLLTTLLTGVLCSKTPIKTRNIQTIPKTKRLAKLRSILSKTLCSNGLSKVISDFAQWLKVITDQNGLITLTKCSN
jgi:hypothetical protein